MQIDSALLPERVTVRGTPSNAQVTQTPLSSYRLG
jgi:hypothetical protein